MILKSDLKKEINYHQNSMKKRNQFLPKIKIKILFGNEMILPGMMKENLNENCRIKVKATPPNIISPAMIEEYGNMIQRYINLDVIENDWGALDQLME